MKRIAIITVMLLAGLAVQASSIRYFTYPQAQRTVQYLGAQQEMMIYCGYDYEIETYVLINEVWMERVNSSYYEIWVFGWDAYTGDEVYMPLDLQCVWLFSAGRMYNAAQYLRFHATVHTPHFAWYIPPYNPYTRRQHAIGYVRSYHYDIHRHGWMPPTAPHHGYGPHTQSPLPPYYMRHRQDPAPVPTQQWTPGIDHPQVSTSSSRSNSGGRGGSSVPTTRPATGSGDGAATGGTSTRGTGTTTRSGNDSGTTNTRGTGTTTRSGNDSGTTNTRGTGTNTRGTGTTTRGTGTTPTRGNTGTATRTSDSTASSASSTPTRNAGTTRSGSATRSTRGSSSSATTRGTNTRSGNSGTTSNRGTNTRSSR